METDSKVKVWAASIGHKLRSARQEQGLRLKDVSRLSGATLPTLSHIERGTRDMKLSTLVALAEALRLDFPSLFQDNQIAPSITDKESAEGYQLEED